MKYRNILLLILITSCSSSKIINYSNLPAVVEGEGILLVGIRKIPENKGYELFETAEKLMSESNQIKYLPEQEYRLIQKGMSKEYWSGDAISDSTILVIALETKCRYLLSVDILTAKGGGTFGSYTPLELDQYNAHYYQESETNSARLLFKLIDTRRFLT